MPSWIIIIVTHVQQPYQHLRIKPTPDVCMWSNLDISKINNAIFLFIQLDQSWPSTGDHEDNSVHVNEMHLHISVLRNHKTDRNVYWEASHSRKQIIFIIHTKDTMHKNMSHAWKPIHVHEYIFTKNNSRAQKKNINS